MYHRVIDTNVSIFNWKVNVMFLYFLRFPRSSILIALLLTILLSLSGAPDVAHGATYTVTSTNDSGLGSLRQAILAANANPGPDIIEFDIAGPGVHTIAVTTELPIITGPVIIDGWSQPGFAGNPLIELSGALAAGEPTFRSRLSKNGIYYQAVRNVGLPGNHTTGGKHARYLPTPRPCTLSFCDVTLFT
jgi:hypothetical protein